MNKGHINMLSLIEHDTPLKRVCGTDGGEYAGPCPWCGGTDRFHVWPQAAWPHYWCRQCGRRGDAIQYMRDYSNLTFRQACEVLGVSGDPMAHSPILASQPRHPRLPTLLPKEWPAFSDPEWQPEAQRFITWAHDNLHGAKGKRARDYCHQRGLTDAVIENARLGYNPSEHDEWWGDTRVPLAQGIVIPWIELDVPRNVSQQPQGRIWKVNIRRLDGKLPKYKAAAGSANGLYGISAFRCADTVALVEGEFCALVLQMVAPGLVTPLATGSTTGSHLHRWLARLALANKIIVAFDADDAGDEAAKWWLNAFPETAIRLSPLHHDVNDMLTEGDPIVEWLKLAL